MILMFSLTRMTNQLDVDLTRKAIGRREGEGRGRTPRVSTPLFVTPQVKKEAMKSKKAIK